MMLKISIILLLISAFEISSIVAFRSDYTYIHLTRSYYKFHKVRTSWADAKSKCRSEDALYFYPENKSELDKVLSVLGVDYDGQNLWIGVSDLGHPKVYETEDGRPLSDVYNKWDTEWKSSSKEETRCGGLFLRNHLLFVDDCKLVGYFICKHQTTEAVLIPAIEDVKTLIAELPRALEQQPNQTAVFERHLEAMQLRLEETMREQATNQTKLLQLLEENQTAALQQLAQSMEQLMRNQTTAFQKLAENVQEQASNQSIALERQSLALEKLADSIPTFISALQVFFRQGNEAP